MKIRIIENYEIVIFTVYSFKKKPKIQKKKIQNLNSHRDKYFDLIRQMITRTVLFCKLLIVLRSLDYTIVLCLNIEVEIIKVNEPTSYQHLLALS